MVRHKPRGSFWAERHKASIGSNDYQIESQSCRYDQNPAILPVEQAKNQQPNLGTDQADRHQYIGHMDAGGRQIKSEQLWHESHWHEPAVMKFGGLPAFVLPSCADQADHQTGKNGSKQNHLKRTATIGCSSTEHQHGK